MTLRLGRDDVARAAAILDAGGLVAIPTETVYGLAADAGNPAAVAAVFTAKGRPASDPLIVHVTPRIVGSDPIAGLVAQGWLAPLPPAAAEVAGRLATTAWPGPLTLVLPAGPAVFAAVRADGPDVAVRVPAHPLARAVIDTLGRPVVAPSANRFGRVSPTTADHVLDELDGRIDAVLDGGPCDVGVESTVVRVGADGTVRVLRPGAFDPRAEVLDDEAGPAGSPGRLPSHYAPRTPVVLVDRAGLTPHEAADPRLAGGVAWIAWSTPPRARHDVVTVLAPDGLATTAARALYGALRDADRRGVGLIVVERPPADDALGRALADRLRRAAWGTPPLGS